MLTSILLDELEKISDYLDFNNTKSLQKIAKRRQRPLIKKMNIKVLIPYLQYQSTVKIFLFYFHFSPQPRVGVSINCGQKYHLRI